MSFIRKYHNHKLQTTPWHREEEPLNHHETPGRQIKQSNGFVASNSSKCPIIFYNFKFIVSTIQLLTSMRETRGFTYPKSDINIGHKAEVIITFMIRSLCLPKLKSITTTGPDSLVDKASASGAGGPRFDSKCRRQWGSF